MQNTNFICGTKHITFVKCTYFWTKHFLEIIYYENRFGEERRVLDRSKYPLVSAGAIFTRGYQRIPS